MATNRQKEAARDFARKVRLEAKINRELRRYFAKVNKAFRAHYAETGLVINTRQFDDEMNEIIFRHYQRVAKVYGGDILDQVKSLGMRETKTVEDDIQDNVERFVAVQSGVRSAIINQTTEQSLNSIVSSIIIQGIEQGAELTNADVAGMASRDFRRSGINRSNVISQTETQNAAEGTKYVEAETVVGQTTQLPDGRFISGGVHEWNSILDNKTRPAHVLADGQRRDLQAGEVFDVDGEQLRYPGDASLGASPENTINCRCLASYVLTAEELAVENVAF